MRITKEKGAVFLMEIGDKLTTGEPHDGRAPDYDDWHLNGDILVWYPVLGHALELSSMGIRVDEDSLARQLKLARLCRNAQSFRSRKQSWKSSCPTPSAAASVSPVSVCSSCGKHTSARYRYPYGRMRPEKKL